MLKAFALTTDSLQIVITLITDSCYRNLEHLQKYIGIKNIGSCFPDVIASFRIIRHVLWLTEFSQEG